ncbi:SDR family oxidoreductase [Salinibacterium sp. dk2585]|uniref:SDR family oxidoreductase n=1 Tax=unclassified Salinibacterium TaxID=2632331 RepID=UPI0011C24E9D|nr:MULTISPECIES: SDR family oxidoreductase [unclassified Salinibacterium]QEE61024.1 SDR family oxidoreductase [Salinibacterium sp. dk2585]TXK52966.1 SDR family oxidoreductase [Salinibacterium sp. dk5596]
MDLGITGKGALVLGAGGGLGGAIAKALAREGVRVAVGDFVEDAANGTVAAIREAGGEAVPLIWDLADLAAMDAALDRLEKDHWQVDIVVHITGGPPPSPVSGQSDDVWRDHFNSMVLPIIHLTDRVLPGMKARGWGRIITSTSSGVVTPIPNLGLSNALRSALLGWSKTLAREVGPSGVTANLVVPGRVATKRITFLDEAKAEREGRDVNDVTAESVSSIPVGRYGDPDEYAAAVAFLASVQAGYITGTTLRVDGGLIPSI